MCKFWPSMSYCREPFRMRALGVLIVACAALGVCGEVGDGFCREEPEVGKLLCPTLFVLGVQKAGTTTLFLYLDSAFGNQARTPRTRFGKEAHFFSRRYRFGMESYLKMFGERNRMDEVAMEGTPNYIGCSIVPARMKSSLNLPQLRFIAIFKDPVARAASWYRHSMVFFAQTRLAMHCAYEVHDYKFSSMAAVVSDEIRSCIDEGDYSSSFARCAHDAQRWVPAGANEDYFENFCSKRKAEYWSLWLFTAGLYGPMMDHWFRYVDPSQFCIVDYEQMLRNFSSIEANLKPCVSTFGLQLDLSRIKRPRRVSVPYEELSNCPLCESLTATKLREIGALLHRSIYTDSNRRFRDIAQEHYGLYFPAWEALYL